MDGERRPGFRTYVGSVGPFEHEGEVGLVIQLTDRRGRIVFRTPGSQIAVEAVC